MRRRKGWLLAGVGLPCLAIGLTAAPLGEHSFEAKLRGFEAVPAVSTLGRGELRMQLNRDETVLAFELTYWDLQANPTVAQVHLGQRGVNGGVMFFLCGGGKLACPPFPGRVTGTVTGHDIVSLMDQGINEGQFDEVIRAIRHGVTYVNVYRFPAGEIRGQITSSD